MVRPAAAAHSLEAAVAADVAHPAAARMLGGHSPSGREYHRPWWSASSWTPCPPRPCPPGPGPPGPGPPGPGPPRLRLSQNFAVRDEEPGVLAIRPAQPGPGQALEIVPGG